VKGNPVTRDVRIVMMTSVANSRQVRGMEGTIVDACVVKPLRQAPLLKVLADALSSARPAGPAHGLAGLAENIGKSAKQAPGSTRRALVADDNAVNQKVAVRMLESLGLRADVAVNGQDAVRMTQRTRYDMILMDWQMPVMNGAEAAVEIRRQEGSGRHTPIVSMTAEWSNECLQECLDCGMDDILHKPFQMQALAEVVRRWCPALPSAQTADPECVPK
jgi:CheY-like chemotaxis protein